MPYGTITGSSIFFRMHLTQDLFEDIHFCPLTAATTVEIMSQCIGTYITRLKGLRYHAIVLDNNNKEKHNQLINLRMFYTKEPFTGREVVSKTAPLLFKNCRM